MSNVIHLKHGLDIKLTGEAEAEVTRLPIEGRYSICPDDYAGITPKLLVREGDQVKAGSPLLFDKNRTEVMIVSPVSGTVSAVNRGEKRKIMSITVDADAVQSYEQFPKGVDGKSRKEVVELLLRSGLWPSIVQRPYGVMANPDVAPKSIFVSGFDSAPLAPDMNVVLKENVKQIETGLKVLAKLTDGKVHLGLRAGEKSVLESVKGATITYFKGPHPAGNVGIQIHHIDPIMKGETVWTVDIQNLVVIGRLFETGKIDMRKVVALTGSQLMHPQYVETVVGTSMVDMLCLARIKYQRAGSTVRLIDGNVLSGHTASADSSLSFYSQQITAIPEGNYAEMFGWMMPRFKKLSVSRTYFSWICPNKHYNLDTNLNGGQRALVFNDIYDRYLPMNIFAAYLIKAVLAGDIDKMEQLGIYEVLPEDLALCEFVDPSKTDIQEIIRNGIDLMIKELS